ncbi:MAG: diaminopimelate epimerase [Acidobacteriota bacterium]|jgi:diaminopimelate epimerase|nr:diaminopimelate epimerase [Acidobacteriota bacterium]
MQRIPFFKMTGTGNDFILIDNRKRVIDPDNCLEFVRGVCRPRVSVGADGVILIEGDPEVDFRWRFFNADGSEPAMCGNGARCAARFAFLTGIAEKPRMAFRTGAGVVTAELWDKRVKVQVPAPHSLRQGVSATVRRRPFALDFIDSGVPHAVCFLEGAKDLEEIDVERWGCALRNHSRFKPEGANVDFAHVEAPHTLWVRTYERGVEGETLACGTGSIAAALLAALRGGVESPVEVHVRSGEVLTVHFKMDGAARGGRAGKGDAPPPPPFSEVCLEGDALVVYEAELWPETL